MWACTRGREGLKTLASFILCLLESKRAFSAPVQPDFHPVNPNRPCSGCGLWIVSGLSSLVSRWQEGRVCALPTADVVRCRRPFGKPSLPLCPTPSLFILQTWNLEDTVGLKKGALLPTHPHKGMNDLQHTNTDCMRVYGTSFRVFHAVVAMFSGFKGCGVNKNQALQLVDDVHRVL